MPSIQPSKRKDGSVIYRVQVSINGVRDSASFDNKADAKQWGLRREAMLRLGPPPAATPTAQQPSSITQKQNPSRTLKDVLDRYRKEVTPNKLSRRWEEIRLKKFALHPMAALPLDELGPEHLAEWRDSRLQEVSTSTVCREITILSGALEVARREWRWIERNPIRDVRKPTPNKHRVQRISDSDLERLLTALNYTRGTIPTTQQQEVAVALLLAVQTACRSGELLALTRDHIHLEQRYFHIPTSKNGCSRDIPLSSAAIDLLQLMLKKPSRRDGKIFVVNSGNKQALFRKAKIKAGLKHINFHDSRREATSRLSEVFNPMELSRITGHKDLKMLLVYYQKPASELAQKLI